MIKVNYDPKTTLVKGYYPDLINYASIPEPFIEIENEAQDNSKQMCVIDGIYQKYQATEAEQVAILQAELVAVRISYLQSTDWYIAREADEPDEPDSYPQKIKNKRILARAEIGAIETATTLTALNEFSTTF